MNRNNWGHFSNITKLKRESRTGDVDGGVEGAGRASTSNDSEDSIEHEPTGLEPGALGEEESLSLAIPVT